MDELENLKSELEKNAVKVTDVNILFLDVSGSCTGYTLVKVNFEKKHAVFLESGSLWLPDTEQEHKCAYMYNAVCNYWNVVSKVDYVVMEKYMINPKKLMGVMVSIEIHGALKAAFSECGLKYSYILSQSWRKLLGIKKNDKGDFKQPTKDYVLSKVTVPEKITNNLTGNERNASTDLYDSLAISMAFLQKLNISNVDFSHIEFQKHVGVIGE